MFGINKCFGPDWGVILLVDDYELAQRIAAKLKEKKGGNYDVRPMSVAKDVKFIEDILGIELS